jgi:PhzF family phenazine biosynthesis protein
LEQNPPVFGAEVSPHQIADVLKIAIDEIASNESPIQAVSVSRPKLIVPLKDWRILNRLEPDFDALWRMCDALHVSGLYPFTRHTNQEKADAESRQFPLRAGFLEDAATGVAAAALGAYLARYDRKYQPGRHEFRIAQGYAMFSRGPALSGGTA